MTTKTASVSRPRDGHSMRSAPPLGRAANQTGAVKPRSAYAATTASATRCRRRRRPAPARSRRTRRRSSGRRSAPASSAAADRDVDLRHGDLEVVAHRGVRRGEQRPDLAQVGRRAARPTTSSTRAFSVTTCRTRRRITSSASRPARRPGRPGRRAAPARPSSAAACLAGPVPLGVLAVDQRVRRPGVDHQQGQPGAGEVERHLLDVQRRQSRNSAWPARPRIDAIWSMTPVGTPTKSFSARWASAGRSSPAAPARPGRPGGQHRALQRRRRRQPGTRPARRRRSRGRRRGTS